MKTLENLHETCRTCLSNLPSLNGCLSLKDFLPNGNQMMTYEDCLNDMLKEKFSLNGTLPNQICLECSKALQITRDFLILVETSTRILKDYANVPFISYEQVESKTDFLQSNDDVNIGSSFEPLCECTVDFLSRNPEKEHNKIDHNNNYGGQIHVDTNTLKETKKYQYKDTKTPTISFKDIQLHRCRLCKFFTCYPESLAKHSKKYHRELVLHEKLRGKKNTQGPQKSFEEEKNVFKCPACYRSFTNEKAKRTHYTLKHLRNKANKPTASSHPCEHCRSKFDTRVGLVAHRRFCKPSAPIKCFICQIDFASNTTFEKHLKQAHGVECLHCCQVCSKTFIDSKSLFLHQKRHNDQSTKHKTGSFFETHTG